MWSVFGGLLSLVCIGIWPTKTTGGDSQLWCAIAIISCIGTLFCFYKDGMFK